VTRPDKIRWTGTRAGPDRGACCRGNGLRRGRGGVRRRPARIPGRARSGDPRIPRPGHLGAGDRIGDRQGHGDTRRARRSGHLRRAGPAHGGHPPVPVPLGDRPPRPFRGLGTARRRGTAPRVRDGLALARRTYPQRAGTRCPGTRRYARRLRPRLRMRRPGPGGRARRGVRVLRRPEPTAGRLVPRRHRREWPLHRHRGPHLPPGGPVAQAAVSAAGPDVLAVPAQVAGGAGARARGDRVGRRRDRGVGPAYHAGAGPAPPVRGCPGRACYAGPG
jgi:hypothetical protein